MAQEVVNRYGEFWARKRAQIFLGDAMMCLATETNWLTFIPQVEKHYSKGLLLVWLAAMCVASIDTIHLILIGTALLAASFTDVLSRRIPNAITYPTALIGLAALLCQLAYRHSLGESTADLLLFRLNGFLVCFGIAFFIWCLGGFGGGDVKLAALLGLLLGANWGLTIFVMAQVLAALYLVGRAIMYRRFSLQENLRGEGLPMAGFFTLGFFITLGTGGWL